MHSLMHTLLCDRRVQLFLNASSCSSWHVRLEHCLDSLFSSDARDEADLGDGGHQKVRQSGANPYQTQPGEAEAFEIEHHVCHIQPHEPKHGPAAPHHLPQATTLIVAHEDRYKCQIRLLVGLKADEIDSCLAESKLVVCEHLCSAHCLAYCLAYHRMSM